MQETFPAMFGGLFWDEEPRNFLAMKPMIAIASGAVIIAAIVVEEKVPNKNIPALMIVMTRLVARGARNRESILRYPNTNRATQYPAMPK